MADDYVIQIVARLRDEASSKVRALQAQIDALKASAAGGRSTQDLSRGLGDVGSSAQGAADETARLNAEHDRLRNLSSQNRNVLRDHTTAHSVAADAVGDHAAATGDLVDAARTGATVFQANRKTVDDLSNSYTRAKQKGEETAAAYERFNNSVRSGTVSVKDATRTYQTFQGDFSRLSRSFQTGSEDALRFGRAADDVGKKIKNMDLARASNDFERFLATVSKTGDSALAGLSGKIISISAALRGFRLVAIGGLLQQLDTAVVGLGGSLVALASDAAQAAGALGGSLVAGIAQAIPAVGVLLVGLERVKSVFAAVKLQQQVAQQTSVNPTQAASTALQTSSALAAAQNGLVNAYDNVVTAEQRVKRSQEELTQARIAAIRNIQDLTLAEKTAAEQATGARLTLLQAEQQLQQVQTSGGTQLQLQQAQLAVREARTGVTSADIAVPRARADAARARRLGVSGNVSVLSATQAARQAPIDLANARFAIQQAQTQLRLAQMTAATPAGQGVTSTQGQLNYLLGQMTGPEKLLYDSLVKLETQLKSPGSPLRRISDAIVSPFATAVSQITKLLGDPKFMSAFDHLANAMGKGLGQILNVKGNAGFFEQMAKDATQNVPIITKIILHIESLFKSIAKAAAPALHQLLIFIEGVTGGLAKTESSASGQKRLTAEFSLWEKRLENILHLLGAFHGLLKAVATDAAPAGNSGVVSFTKAIRDATDWVKTHGPEVRKFFDDSIKVLGTIGGLLFNVGKLMLSVFNPSTLAPLATFLSELVFPAVRDVATALGWFLTGLLKIINSIGPLRGILEGVTAGFVGLLVVNKVADGFLAGFRAVRAFWGALQTLKETGSIVAALKTFSAHMNNVRDSAKGASDQVKISAAETETALTTEQAAVTEKTAVIDADLAGVGASAGTMATKTTVAATTVDTAVAGEATAVTAADTTIEAENVAAGRSFTALLGPIGLVALGVAAIAKGIRNALGVGQGLQAGAAAQPGQHQSPQAGEAAAKKLFATGVSGYKSWQDIYLAMVAAGEIKGQGPNAPGANALPGLPGGGSTGAGGASGATGGSAASGALSFFGPNGALALAQGASSATGGVLPAGLGTAQTILGNFSGGQPIPKGSSPLFAKSVAFANLTTAQHYNYEWGGGHNASFSPSHGTGHGSGVGTGYDCSGVISALLHNDGLLDSPLDSTGFMSYGMPGPGGPGDITIYANPDHVFAEIGNSYFGTSGANPGGGAGWFSSADTSGFVVRHVSLGGGGASTSGSSASQWANSVANAQKSLGGAAGFSIPPVSAGGGSSSGGGGRRGGGGGGSGHRTFVHIPHHTLLQLDTTKLFPAFPSALTGGAFDPANTIGLISKFFKAFQQGMLHMHTAGEKMAPLTQQIGDFVAFSSNVLDNLFPVLQAAFQQLSTRLGDRGILAGLRTGAGGVVSSRGVGAADSTIIAGDQQLTRGLRGQQRILRATAAQITRQRHRASRITDPARKLAALTALGTLFNRNQADLTGVNDQLAQSTATTFGAEQTQVQNLLTGVSNRFGTQQAGLQATQGQFQSLGRFDLLPGVDMQLANSAESQLQALFPALAKAQHIGDKTAVAQITQQIYQLNAAITQYATQAIQDAISAIQQQAGVASARTGLLSTLAGIATTAGQFGLAEQFSAASFQNAITSDRSQLSSYNSLLATAMATGNTGAVATILTAIDGLTADLATNVQALQDNTAATDNAAASYTQSRGQFQTGVYGGLASIVQTLGQTTGYTDVSALKGLYTASNNSLGGTNSSLAGTLFSDFGVDVRGQSPAQQVATLGALNLPAMEAGMDPATATLFENLISGIITNTLAIAANNLQLATLNGQLTQPQSFATNIWKSFRDAIFTGMGGLQPAYAASLGLAPTSNPAFTGTGIGGSSINVHVHPNPTMPEVDPYTQGKQIAFAMKTPR